MLVPENPLTKLAKTNGNIWLIVLKVSRIKKIKVLLVMIDPCQNNNLFKDLKLTTEKSLFYDA